MLGSDLVGLKYHSLFRNPVRNIEQHKIIPSSHVTAISGTGLVHCAPAHGADDYKAFHALGLLNQSTDIVCHVDLAGRFTDGITDVVGEERGRELVGLEVLYRGGKEMVKVLERLDDANGEGRLVKVERVNHRFPYDWRTKKPIIVL
jgi:isoleucyl-tRNA synthetase